MANNSHRILQDINDNELDFKSSIDEDLMGRLAHNLYALAAMIDGQPNRQFIAKANGTPTDGGATSVLTIDTITEGVFERDDQYNEKYILVTTGPASGQGIESRFPITDSDESAQTFTCGENTAGENLNEAGMVNDDDFELMGHVHDGVDGEVRFWDDIVGQSGLEERSAVYSVSVGGGGGAFSTTITHNLGRTPTQITVISYWLSAGVAHKCIGHWSPTEANVVVMPFANYATPTLPLVGSNTHNAVGNTSAALPTNANPDVDIISVGASTFKLDCVNSAGPGDFKALLLFS